MQERSPSKGHRRLSAELEELLLSLDGQDITLGGIVDSIGERGFGLLLMILALPAALPVPAPGYATPFGILIATLGFQMFLRRDHPRFPQAARRRTIRYSSLKRTIRGAGFPLRVAETLVRPRLSGFATNHTVEALLGLVILILGAFMCLPIPLTNTAPSFVIFLLACGLLEEDGLVILAGLFAAPVAAGIAVLALYFAWTHGIEALDEGLRPLLQRLFG